MVRTAATAVRVSGGKSAKAIRHSAPSTSGLQSSRNSGSIGGNPAAHRETPAWQKPITNFFRKTEAESTTTTTLPTNNENLISTEIENIPNTSSRSVLQEDVDEITKNKRTDDVINISEEECRPQTSAYSENKSESENKNKSEDKNKTNDESENKENENHNSNTDNDCKSRKTPRDADDADLSSSKKPRIDYKYLEAIEKFAS